VRKAETSRRIQGAAVRLFLERGFDNVTVEEIAAAAGVSHMTVFRHFSTKEQIVLSDDYDPLIVAAIRRRPPSEPAIDAVEAGIGEVLGRVTPAETELLLQRTRLIFATPALRTELWASWLESQQLIAAALAERGGPPQDQLALRVVAGLASVTAATAALTWYEEGGRRPLGEVLAEAFAAARAEMAKTGTSGTSPA